MDNEIPKSKNKKVRGATKVVYNGIRFDSKLEAECYQLLQSYGIPFVLKPRYVLQEKFVYLSEHIRSIEMEPDFYLPEHDLIVETKGFANDVYPVKVKMLKHFLWVNGLETGIVVIATKKELHEFFFKLKHKIPL